MLPVSPCCMKAWPPIATSTIGRSAISVVPLLICSRFPACCRRRTWLDCGGGTSAPPACVRDESLEMIDREGPAREDDREARQGFEDLAALGLRSRDEG